MSFLETLFLVTPTSLGGWLGDFTTKRAIEPAGPRIRDIADAPSSIVIVEAFKLPVKCEVSPNVTLFSTSKSPSIFPLIAASLALVSFQITSSCIGTLAKTQVLGLGDSQLASVGGAWLGLAGVTAAICLAFISAAGVGLAGRLSGRLKPFQPFPFGPFISMGIWGVWIFGPNWWWNQWLYLMKL